MFTLVPPKRLPVPMPDMPTVVLKPDDFSAEATFIRLLTQAINLATIANDNTWQVYLKACQFWQESVEWYQATKVTMPPKPAPPNAYDVEYQKDVSVWRAVLASNPLGEACPDPIAPVLPSTFIGNKLYGSYYVSLPGDTTPDGAVITTDPRGTFTMIRSPFGGWYLKS